MRLIKQAKTIISILGLTSTNSWESVDTGRDLPRHWDIVYCVLQLVFIGEAAASHQLIVGAASLDGISASALLLFFLLPPMICSPSLQYLFLSFISLLYLIPSCIFIKAELYCFIYFRWNSIWSDSWRTATNDCCNNADIFYINWMCSFKNSENAEKSE